MTAAKGQGVQKGPGASLPSLRLFDALQSRLFRLLHRTQFGSWGDGTLVLAPIGIEGASDIHLGSRVFVAARTCLAARAFTGDRPRLEIGDGCKIGRFNHIYATGQVILEAKVLTANGVYISDNAHAFEDIGLPVMDQPVRQLGETVIGAGSWLGHNACVLGARVGRHCVIGANTVLTRNVPDFSVVVGAPGRVIRRFDIESGIWRPTHADGAFRNREDPAG